ncbi:hypothetical protein IMG5_124850 [Ichthyophthirius multifiliis]|uniref:AB hydrolase-1 domain-containing protein n=1 Tax=Ichthyophthirius multifiliis TaxID=5932 RepID=G0QVN1_ICHMU|nr:hypothetical protein IMG5_124850 [Ichthyophthirius multifiliis]EGR30718.1 hypothetical protein IMG5_124850 [Ichthyophthirius multifiliis]|eukprot:XP_004032305.1 hypothetical protein IMG5_124850 [Ichthyophthirius multifiliis]
MKTIVLLHGYGNTSLSYYKMIKDLSFKFDTYALDLLGMGLSSRPKYEINDIKETIEFFVESLELWRQKIKKQDKLVLVGHSFGGYMALNYALKYPQNVENLILLSPMGATKKSEKENQQFEKETKEKLTFYQKIGYIVFQNMWEKKQSFYDIYNQWYYPREHQMVHLNAEQITEYILKNV